MNFVKYFFLLMGSSGFLYGAESDLSGVNLQSGAQPSISSMADYVTHAPVPAGFLNDYISSCQVTGGNTLWVTSSKDMQGGLWTIGADKKMVSLGTIVPPATFGIGEEVEGIRLKNIANNLFLVARYTGGVEVYTIKNADFTGLERAVNTASSLLSVVGEGVAGLLTSARDRVQQRSASSQSMSPISYSLESGSVVIPPLSARARERIVREGAVDEALESKKWSLVSLPGGSVVTPNETVETVFFEEEAPGVIVLQKPKTASGNGFSSLLHYVQIRDGKKCIGSPCPQEWDTILKQDFSMLTNIYAIASNGKEIVFRGLGNRGKKLIVVMGGTIRAPQKIASVVDTDEISRAFPIPSLMVGVVALLRKKNLSGEDIGRALQEFNRTVDELAGVTSEYLIARLKENDNLLQQLDYHDGKWVLGKFVFSKRNSLEIKMFENGNMMGERGHFYSYPATFVLGSGAQELRKILAQVSMGAITVDDLQTALGTDDEGISPVSLTKRPSARQDIEPSAADSSLMIAEHGDASGALEGNDRQEDGGDGADEPTMIHYRDALHQLPAVDFASVLSLPPSIATVPESTLPAVATKEEDDHAADEAVDGGQREVQLGDGDEQGKDLVASVEQSADILSQGEQEDDSSADAPAAASGKKKKKNKKKK